MKEEENIVMEEQKIEQKPKKGIEFLKGLGTILLYFILAIIGNLIFSYEGDNKVITSLYYIGVYVVLLLGLGIVYRKRLINDFKSFKKEYIRVAFINWILGIAFMIFFSAIVNIFVKDQAATQASNEEMLLAYPIPSLLYMVFMAPMCEEITFRASFKKAFSKWYTFALVTGFLFGLAHMSSPEPLQFLYIFVYGSLGFFFAKAFYETDNIYTSFLMHMFHNLLSVTIIFLGSLL